MSQFIHSGLEFIVCLSKHLRASHSLEAPREARHQPLRREEKKRAADNITNQTPRVHLLSEWPGRFTESEINGKIYGERRKRGDLRGKTLRGFVSLLKEQERG